MSRENVEAVRTAWDAWERGDMEALFRLYDPDIEWDQTRHLAGGPSGVFGGHEGVRRFFREWLSSFDIIQGGRGKGSGIAVEMPPYSQLYRLRHGRAVRVEVYSDRDEALKAAGLRA
jgi:ketosteroid isomerase-like protein